MQRTALCRSRRELSNAHLLPKCGFDKAENEPCKVCPIPRGAAARKIQAGPAYRCGALEEGGEGRAPGSARGRGDGGDRQIPRRLNFVDVPTRAEGGDRFSLNQPFSYQFIISFPFSFSIHTQIGHQ